MSDLGSRSPQNRGVMGQIGRFWTSFFLAKWLAAPMGSSKTTEAIRTMSVSFDRSRRMLFNGLNGDDLQSDLQGHIDLANRSKLTPVALGRLYLRRRLT
jgi:hypothetical protein